VCKKWKGYLESYLTKTERLFGESEYPWEGTERELVSTLSASITRGFPGSIVLGEGRVTKPGQATNLRSNKKTDSGFCDLWFSIPETANGKPVFSAYLEAKKTANPKGLRTLQRHLAGKYGISKLFKDYLKSSSRGLLAQRSAYGNSRKHEHYVIGLLIVPLSNGKGEPEEIDSILQSTFEKGHKLFLRPNEGGLHVDRRRMARYPTVSLIVTPTDERSGMLASFTVLGSTKKLSASWKGK